MSTQMKYIVLFMGDLEFKGIRDLQIEGIFSKKMDAVAHIRESSERMFSEDYTIEQLRERNTFGKYLICEICDVVEPRAEIKPRLVLRKSEL